MKILKLAVLAALAVGITGCGNKPKLPEGTIAAVYVDVQKALSSGQDITKMVIDQLPEKFAGESLRDEARKNYEKGMKELEEDLKKANLSLSSFKWLTASIGNVENVLYRKEPDLVLVACIDGIQDLPLQPREKNICGEKAYHGMAPFNYVVVYDKNYILAGSTESALDTLIQTYKGDKPCSPHFGDLMDLSGSTIARAQVDGIADLLSNPKFEIPTQDGKKSPADAIKYYLKDIDEDMGEYIAELEGLTLDLNVADDDVGATFTVVCGSSSAAKLVEQVFGTLALAGRIWADAAVVSLRDFTEEALKVGSVPYSIREEAGKLQKQLRECKFLNNLVSRVGEIGQNIETDRSGSEVSISFSIPLDDIVEDICDGAEEIEKLAKSL